MKYLGKFFFLFCLTILLSSCSQETVFFLSFHEVVSSQEVVDGGGGIVIPAHTADGKGDRYIRRIPIFSSTNICSAELLPTDDDTKCGIRLYFDHYSKPLWNEAVYYHRDREMAVMMDTWFVGYTKFTGKYEDGVIDVDPIFHIKLAQKIVARAEENFKILNKKSTSWDSFF